MQLYVAKRFMKKTKILTIAGVMLAMALTGCKTGGKTSESKAPESTGNPTTAQPTSQPSTSTPAPSTSTPAPQPVVVPDPDGHHFGADADVAADAESGAVAYKKATCSDNDGFERLKINQSAVTYGQGSSRKNGTPDGYTKLDGNGQTMSFKFKTDKKYSGKLFLYGVMDGYSSNLEKNFCYYQGSPNVEVKVNGQVIDISAQKDVKFQDIFGNEADPETDNLSPENYALLGNVTLEAGVNEIIYKRVATLNMLIKDFVFVVEEYSEWTPAEAVAAKGDGYVGYSKRTSRVDGATKIEINALDGAFDQTTDPVSQNKDGTAEGYLKLNKDGNKISWKFDFAKAGFAQIYQYGFMDSFSSNVNKTYSHVSSSDASKTTEEGNLRVKFNDAVVDKGPYMHISFKDLTADGDNTIFEAEKNYSPIALLPLGQATMAAGDNTIEFERLGSYNFVISKLVIYFYETAPVPATEFKGDATGHWNEYEGLPKARFNYADHTIEEAAFTNSQGKEGKVKTCSVCGQMVGAEMDLLACDDATTIADGKLALNTAYTWRFKLGEANAAAGKAAFYMTVKRGAASTNLAQGYTLASGDVNGTVTCINERIGSGYSSAKELKIGEITLEKLDANGEFVVTFKTPEAQENMPIWSGAVRLSYIG